MIKSCKKPPVYFESTTGSFYSQYAGLPLKSCRVDLPVNQSGSGTPSPTNIRDLIPYTALDFTANGTVKTFTFGQNVYIGYLDVLSGVLTVTHGYVDMGSLPLEKVTNVESEYWTALLPSAYKYISSQTNWICNKYTKASVGATGSSEGIFITNSNYVRVRDLSVSSASEFNGTQLVYELETPITIPLGGMEINTILGLNSLSSSVGTISAEYLKAGR